MLKIPAPRLLPATILAVGGLLVLKCGILLQVGFTHGPKPDSAIVAAAHAAGTEAAKEQPKPAGAETSKERVKPPAGKEAAKEHGAPASGSTPPPADPKQAASTSAVAEGPPPVSESEKALLQELRQRRQELDARAEAVATRESLLAATEQKLANRVTELQILQKKLEGLDTAQKQKEDAGWQGLVKLYEAMKPKDAATIFSDLSMPVLLQVLDRMKDSKAAAVMAAMNPDKARDVTADLAQLRTGHDVAQTPRSIQAGG